MISFRLRKAFGVTTLSITFRARWRKRYDDATLTFLAREPNATAAQASLFVERNWWPLPADDEIPKHLQPEQKEFLHEGEY